MATNSSARGSSTRHPRRDTSAFNHRTLSEPGSIDGGGPSEPSACECESRCVSTHRWAHVWTAGQGRADGPSQLKCCTPHERRMAEISFAGFAVLGDQERRAGGMGQGLDQALRPHGRADSLHIGWSPSFRAHCESPAGLFRPTLLRLPIAILIFALA